MKQLTKIQKEIEGLAVRVPKLTERQMSWARKNYTYLIGLLGNSERECVCPECHGILDIPESHKDEKHRCPYCGAKLRIARFYDSRGMRWSANGVMRDYHREGFFQVMNVVGDWQVTRLFYMERWCYVRKDNTPWRFYECCQSWNKPDNPNTYFRSLPKQGMGYHYNCYSIHRWGYECTNFDKETYNKYIECDNTLEARKPNSANYFDTNNLAPDAQILPAYKRFGMSAQAFRSIRTYNAMGLMQHISEGKLSTMHETLIKCGAYDIFNRLTESGYLHGGQDSQNAIYTAWKICRRNNYNYKKNLTEWCDLVNMLAKYGFDYHSPHYVCPDNLHAMHQRMLRLVEREKEEMELRRVAAMNKSYAERIAKFLDLDIHNEELTIKALPDIESFKKEGDTLGHCVYRCEYYNKENSLILSARGKGGKRWETIEVSLKDLTILQCYGYADKHTEKHQEILDLVNANMWQIKERRDNKRLAKAS